ncbi:lipoyl synthase [Hydrogenimonas urashimensis]|uniref:lipoyl synthase n=1 Tax=Hydrogenimonas urashimensis TaxID=2740515 RepID=UPI0019155794|nr:lipoyl synthase [Hydrogenimonas urashimensis]
MQTNPLRKPPWLRKKITPSTLREVEAMLVEGGLRTICQEALCPNIGECFSKKEATFLILGHLCTRGCTFCNVTNKRPFPPDPDEPKRLADTVIKMGLRHVVVTSPTRDDLRDGGAAHFCETVRAIKARDSKIVVELLVPDFQENEEAIRAVAQSGAEIVGHNIETVPRLYHIRKGADYGRSLRVLQKLHAANPAMATKSGIMLGLGEKREEVLKTMEDILKTGCRFLSIGQYLAPGPRHTPVVEYVAPSLFEFYRTEGEAMGYRYIKSSPYTRSSYMAHEYLSGGC